MKFFEVWEYFPLQNSNSHEEEGERSLKIQQTLLSLLNSFYCFRNVRRSKYKMLQFHLGLMSMSWWCSYSCIFVFVILSFSIFTSSGLSTHCYLSDYRTEKHFYKLFLYTFYLSSDYI